MPFSEKQFAKGFTVVPNELFLDDQIRAMDIAVFAAIRSFMYGDRKCWAPGYREIARRAGCSIKTARKSASKLERLGYYMITRRKPPEGQPKPSRPTHIFTLVQNRVAFLKDRAQRDKKHAEEVTQAGHRKVLQTQAQAFQGKLSKEEANAEIQRIKEQMDRRSPRVHIDPPSEIR